MPTLDPLSALAVRAWNLLEGTLHSPLLPLLCVEWGVDDVAGLIERLAMIRDYQKTHRNDGND